VTARFAIAAAALAFASPAFADTQDAARKYEIAYLTLSAIDAAETIHCLDQHKCTEANPLFGKHPSAVKLIAGKVALGAIHYVAFNRLNERNPKAALRYAQISVGLQGGVVMWNLRVMFK
jgi:hypothetical protein